MGCKGDELRLVLDVARQVRRRLLHCQNELLGYTEDALADALVASSRHWEKAAAACSRSIKILEMHYPAGSLTVANEQLKCAALLRNAGRLEEGALLEEQACHVVRLHFGSDNSPLSMVC